MLGSCTTAVHIQDDYMRFRACSEHRSGVDDYRISGNVSARAVYLIANHSSLNNFKTIGKEILMADATLLLSANRTRQVWKLRTGVLILQ